MQLIFDNERTSRSRSSTARQETLRTDCHAAEALAYMQGSQDDRKQSRAGSKVTQPTIQSRSQAQAPPDCSKKLGRSPGTRLYTLPVMSIFIKNHNIYIYIYLYTELSCTSARDGIKTSHCQRILATRQMPATVHETVFSYHLRGGK